MIRRYNRSQIAKAVILTFGGFIFCWVAYLFFRYVPVFVCWELHYSLPAPVAVSIGIAGLAVAWFSGYSTWRARGGLFSYHESGLYHDLGDDTAGAVVTDHYVHRVTAPAYVLGQVFMVGPQWLLRAWTLVHSRIPYSAALELRLENTLGAVRAANKWQGLSEYPDNRAEILYLAQMGLIDFSAHNDRPRFKAR